MSSKTKKFLIVSLVLVLCSCVVYGGLWYAVLVRTAAVHAEMTQAAELGEKHRTLATLAKTLASTKSDREELTGFIIDDDRVTEFLGLLESSARGLGLTVTTKEVKVVPLADNASFESLALTIEVGGEFERVRTFISLLETVPFQVHMGSITLERVSDATENIWKASFVLQATKTKTP